MVKATKRRSQKSLLESLAAQGFDQSYHTTSGVKVKCSQCEAAAINGIACHETGCPNTTHECKGCNATLTRKQGAYCSDCH